MEQNQYYLKNTIIYSKIIRNKELYKTLKKNGIKEIALSYHFGMQDDISFVKSDMLNNLISDLVKNGFKVKLMTTISTDNYKKIPEMCKRAHELGASTIKFTNYVFQGNAQTRGREKVLSRKQIDYVLDTIEKCREKYDIKDLKIERCGTFGPKQDNKEKFECPACNDSVVVTPDLNVYQCVFDIDKGNEIGKVIDNKIMIYDKFKNADKRFCKILNKYNGVDQ